MDLQQYIATKKAPRRIPAAIEPRWDERVTPNGIEQQGEGCFQAYAGAGFANNIGADKCLAFAWCALTEGFPAAADSFFRQAAQLEGIQLSGVGNSNAGATTPNIAHAPAAQPQVLIPGFPRDRQPGRFITMQPEDARCDRKHYIQDDFYWGQPKIDGNKLIIFVSLDQVWYQSREGNLRQTPNAGLEAALKSVSRIMGHFVLEGELVYFDANGKEWMTAAEATKSNMKMGEPGRLPLMAYAVFICNWRYNDPLRTYGEMVELGARIAEMCKAAGSSVIRSIPTARTRAEKEHLVYQQQAQGREGEVWFIPSIPYTAGKNTEDALIRTKYLTELSVRVMGYTQASNPAYAFGALCLESMDGKDLGQLGTGFSLEERQVLKDKFDECGPFSVEVRCQGWTSDEKLRHARFLKVA